MTDKEIALLFGSDPDKALAEAVKLYSGYVYKIVLTRLSKICAKEDIDEAVSDIFFKLFSAARDGKEFTSVGGYISVIAQRHCIDVFRKITSRAQDIPLDEIAELSIEQEIFADTSQELMTAIKSLGEPDTQIFLRRYFFGQRNKYIARELGMTTAAVNKRISRGLVKLKEILKEGER
jgi:RNA polymerase sigma-70 factor (ECF subfamily)